MKTLESDETDVFGGYSMRESPMKLMGDLNRLWDAASARRSQAHGFFESTKGTTEH